MRLLQSRQDDASCESGFVGRHQTQCPDCAAYFAQVSGLDSALRYEADHAAPVEIPGGLEARIWTAVQPEVAARRVGTRSGWTVGWRPLALGAMAVLTVAMVWMSPRPASSLSDQSVAMAQPGEFDETDLHELLATLETQSTELLATVAQVNDRGSQPDVLKQELIALGSDARGALRFLERNFVPSGMQSRDEAI
tara:strand:+ start:338 stop:922 length:585 start_codon:yes stop_codon:yes gene_type:complete